MADYLKQNSNITLGEAIDEYYATYSDYFSDRKKSPDAADFFRCHDVAHVVFGCTITLDDEAVVKICSLFGTTIGFDVLRGYRLAESREGYAELSLMDIVLTTLKSVALVPRTLWRCQRMSKRWPWDEYQTYMEQPLAEIRGEFGIVVAH